MNEEENEFRVDNVMDLATHFGTDLDSLQSITNDEEPSGTLITSRGENGEAFAIDDILGLFEGTNNIRPLPAICMSDCNVSGNYLCPGFVTNNGQHPANLSLKSDGIGAGTDDNQNQQLDRPSPASPLPLTSPEPHAVLEEVWNGKL